MPSADEIVQKMRAVQERRMAAAGPLVEVLTKRTALLEQVAELDEPYGKAYVEAEAAGWTAEELAEWGAEEPARRPRVRSKRSRSAAGKTGGQTSGTAPAGASPAGTIPAQDGAAADVPTAPGAAST